MMKFYNGWTKESLGKWQENHLFKFYYPILTDGIESGKEFSGNKYEYENGETYEKRKILYAPEGKSLEIYVNGILAAVQ